MNSVIYFSPIYINKYQIDSQSCKRSSNSSKSGDSYMSSSIKVGNLENLMSRMSLYEDGENQTGMKPMLVVPPVEAGKDGMVTEGDDHYSEIAEALNEPPRKIQKLAEKGLGMKKSTRETMRRKINAKQLRQ